MYTRKIYLFWCKKSVRKIRDNYFNIGDSLNKMIDDLIMLRRMDVKKYILPPDILDYDTFKFELSNRYYGLNNEFNKLRRELNFIFQNSQKVRIWHPINLLKYKKLYSKYLNELEKLDEYFKRLKESLVLKEIKRIYSSLDPYGEEDWDE